MYKSFFFSSERQTPHVNKLNAAAADDDDHNDGDGGGI